MYTHYSLIFLLDILVNAINNIFRLVFELLLILYKEKVVKLSILLDHYDLVKHSCIEVRDIDNSISKAELLVSFIIII